jgi:hypothetical protein
MTDPTNTDAEDAPVTAHDTAESVVGEPDLVLDATANNETADQDAPSGNEGLGWGGDEEEEIVPVESPYD